MDETAVNTRRRGDTLSTSIYNAILKLIDEVGYENLTFQQIAKVAKTSRTVLYRRGATKFDLIRGLVDDRAKEIFGGKLIDKIENTGNLRGDLLHILTLYLKLFKEFNPAILNVYFFEIMQGNEEVVRDYSDTAEKNIFAMHKLLDMAKARGERIKDVSDLTLTLPFKLIRMEYLMNRNVLYEKQIVTLVDEILLPVFTDSP